MIWAKVENGKVTAVCQDVPPTSEAGTPQTGWEKRLDSDADVKAYYQTQLDPFQIARSSTPNMLAFRQAMLANTGYLRVTATAAITSTGMLNVTRLEDAMLVDYPHWQTVQGFWEQIINSLSILAKPTTAEITTWNTICQQNRVTAIAFSSNGQITLK